MANIYEHNYQLDYYRETTEDNHQTYQFVPDIRSIRAAHALIRRHEKKRRMMTKLARQARKTFSASRPTLEAAIALGDNIIPIRRLGAPRPASRLAPSRYRPRPYARSPAAYDRSPSPQRQALRSSRYVAPQRLWSPGSENVRARDTDAFEGVTSEILSSIGFMALQGLAIALGLGAVLALLNLA